MPDSALNCYRCGASLSELSLPLSRQDECPACSVYLHVCRMCVFFDPTVPKQCREDDAEEVKLQDKERANFCEWFKPSDNAFDGSFGAGEARSKRDLATLFGDGEAGGSHADDDDVASDAEDLFK